MDAYEGLPGGGGGPYPIVIFSHGLGGFDYENSHLAAHLASWGFVVVAPQHRQWDWAALLTGAAQNASSTDLDEVNAAVDALRAEADEDDSPLHNRVDFDTLIASGHERGGDVARRFADDDRVVGYFTLSYVAPAGSPAAPKPALHIAGSTDTFSPASEIVSFARTTPGPTTVAVVDGLSFAGSLDLCLPLDTPGGVTARATAAGMAVPPALNQFALTMCKANTIGLKEGWAAVNHLVVAHLRRLVGADATDAASLPEGETWATHVRLETVS